MTPFSAAYVVFRRTVGVGLDWTGLGWYQGETLWVWTGLISRWDTLGLDWTDIPVRHCGSGLDWYHGETPCRCQQVTQCPLCAGDWPVRCFVISACRQHIAAGHDIFLVRGQSLHFDIVLYLAPPAAILMWRCLPSFHTSPTLSHYLSLHQAVTPYATCDLKRCR